MVTFMNDRDIHTLEQVQRFVEGTEALELQLQGKDERYVWTEQTLRRFGYRRLSKSERNGAGSDATLNVCAGCLGRR